MTRVLIAVFSIVVFPLAVAAQPTSIEGFYVGGTVGSVSGSANLTMSTIQTPDGYSPAFGTYFVDSSVPAVNAAGQRSVEPAGLSAGGRAGYNWRAGRFVLGVEADLGSMPFDESVSATGTYPCCIGFQPFVLEQSLNTDWVMTARPRVGVVGGGWLLYGTGGVALTSVTYSGTFNDFVIFPSTESASMNEASVGWTAGGGAEFAMGMNAWSLTAMYLYTDFGLQTITSTNLTQDIVGSPLAFTNAPFTHTVKLKAHVVRFGVNYRF